MNSVNLDLFDFGLEHMPELEAALEGSAKMARATKTRDKIHARRAASEKVLSEILPEEIEMGDSWHVLSSGDVDSMSFMAHLMRHADMDYCAFSTWCMAVDDVRQFVDWLEAGRIKRLDAYVGEIFPGSYPKEYAALLDAVSRYGGRVAVFRNHSKVFLARSGHRAWVVQSSANINTNPRTENTCITGSVDLFDHHKAYFDGIRSFVRDFDDVEAAA